jgi:hypothetical protein
MNMRNARRSKGPVACPDRAHCVAMPTMDGRL